MPVPENRLNPKDIVIRRCFDRPEDISILVQRLARYFASHPDIAVGIHELLVNAVEHGNLDIGSEMKADLLRKGQFHREMARRLALPENCGKYVEITIRSQCGVQTLSIQDMGKGFDWKACLGESGAGGTAIHGRGLLIASQCGFSGLTFNKAGNCAICTIGQEVDAPKEYDAAAYA